MQNVTAIIVNNCDFEEQIYGLTLVNWLEKAVKNYKYNIINDINNAKEYVQNSEYALVLFSSFPLIQEKQIGDIIDYTLTKQLDFCDFIGGYIIKSKYLTQEYNIITSSTYNIESLIQVKDPISLNNAKQQLRKRIIQKHIDNGVLFENSDNCIIDETVNICAGVVIGNNCELRGNTNIDQNGQISNSYLYNVVVKSNVKIISSFLEECEIESGANVGPYSRIRKGTVIGNNCKIGNFVELKQAKIQKNTKISHLTYVGDAEIGENCNLGCGVIFCNYDGKNKHKTVIGDNCFIGSNVNLVAPLTINNNCFIACGSTITKNMQENKFAIERAELKIKDNKF